MQQQWLSRLGISTDFAQPDNDSLPTFRWSDWELPNHMAIIGPVASGKTTLVRSFLRHFPREGPHALPEILLFVGEGQADAYRDLPSQVRLHTEFDAAVLKEFVDLHNALPAGAWMDTEVSSPLQLHGMVIFDDVDPSFLKDKTFGLLMSCGRSMRIGTMMTTQYCRIPPNFRCNIDHVVVLGGNETSWERTYAQFGFGLATYLAFQALMEKARAPGGGRGRGLVWKVNPPTLPAVYYRCATDI